MPSNKPYKINRRHKQKNWLLVLLLLIAALLIALAIAALWQLTAGTASSSSSDGFSSQSATSVSSQATVSSSQPSSSEPEEPPAAQGPLATSEQVNSSYFDDAVFVGDSVTEGMLYYVGMENAKILAGTGVNFSTIYTTQVIKREDGSRVSIMEELALIPYKKVYIMLGGNEVRDQDKETFLTRYAKVLDDIKALQPNAIYYVQSMTPVTRNNNYQMDNKRIDEYNLGVMQLAHDKGMYYLNVAECLKDANGMLPDDASPADGMHFGQPYFDKWYAYLKTHVAPQEDSASSQSVVSSSRSNAQTSSSKGD